MFLHFLAAFFLGSLVGLMVGMSASPVVASVLGAITVVVIAFFGVRQEKAEVVHSRQALVRTVGLSLGCMVSLLSGLHLRGSDHFGSSLKTEFAEWVGIGFTADQARGLVAYKHFGLLLGRSNSVELAKATAGGKDDRPIPGVLYGSADTAKCSELDPERYRNMDELLNAFRLAKGPWAEIARQVEGLPKEHRLQVLKLTWRLQCETTN